LHQKTKESKRERKRERERRKTRAKFGKNEEEEGMEKKKD
jgi:hypothetical protein